MSSRVDERATTARQRVAAWLDEADAEIRLDRFITAQDGNNNTYHEDHTNPEAQLPADSQQLRGNYGIHFGDGLLGVDVDDVEAFYESGAAEQLPLDYALAILSAHAEDEPTHYLFAVSDNDGITAALDDLPGGSRGKVAANGCEVAFGSMMFVGPGSQRDADKCTSGHCNGKCEGEDSGWYEIAYEGSGKPLTHEHLYQAFGNGKPADLGGIEADAGDSNDETPRVEADKQASGGSENDENGDYDDYDEYLTDDDIAEALSHIPKGLDYDPWLHIAFAVHDYDASDDGKQLFVDWSSDGEKWNSGSRDELDSAWESATDSTRGDGNKITLGHLIQTAEEHGWEKPDPPSRHAALDEELERRLDGDRDDGDGDSDNEEGEEEASDEMTWDDLPIRSREGKFQARPTRLWATAFLLEEETFATPRPDDVSVGKTPILRYAPDKGCFEDGGTGWIHQHVGGRVAELETSDLKEIANRVRRRTYADREAFDAGSYDDVLINLKNGVYNLATEELLDHSPEYLFRTTVPQQYDADAECPQITDFIHDIVPGDDERRTLFEWIGFCLEAGYPIHRFLILHGNGRNGKSTYFDLIEEFLSEDNVSGVTLDTIADGGFGVSELDDKLMNVDGETANTRMEPGELDTLKAMSGGDTRQVDAKYQAPFTMKNDAKLAFAANNPPRFDETTDAIADRLLAIELPYRFEDDENADKPKETDILDRIATADELSGLLNKALEGLQRVRERGHFSIEEDKSARERFEDYQALSDSIIAFSRFCLTNETGFAMPKSAVYNAYCAYCDDKRHTPAEERAFFRQLGRKGEIELNTKRPRIQTGDKTVRPRVLDACWITAAGLQYLSPTARDETLTVIQQLHDGNADYVQDLLLRSGDGSDGDSESEAEAEAGEEISQDERLSLAKEAIGDDGALHADIVNALLDEGVSESNTESALDKLNRDGIIYQPADEPLGSYRLNN